MQPSYLPFSWLKTIEQSILSKKLFVKPDTALLQVIPLIGWQLLLCDRIIDCFQVVLVHPWLNKSAKQRLVPSDIQRISELRRDTKAISSNVVTTKLLFHPQQMLWSLILYKIALLVVYQDNFARLIATEKSLFSPCFACSSYLPTQTGNYGLVEY